MTQEEIDCSEETTMGSGFCDCCTNCPNKTVKQDFCYNGTSVYNCPAYRTKGSTQPPKDIRNMLYSS